MRELVAQAGGPVTAGDSDADGAGGGKVVLAAGTGLEELGCVDGGADELELAEDPHPASATTPITAAASHPARPEARRPAPAAGARTAGAGARPPGGAAEGIGFFFSSGDNGYESPAEDPGSDQIQVDWPDSSPYVTAVGGTSLATSNALRGGSGTLPPLPRSVSLRMLM